MPYYLTFDGGGTKVKAIVFDDSFNVISYKKSGGINANFYKPDEVRRHIDESIGEAIRECGHNITAAYGVIVSSGRGINDQIQSYIGDVPIRYFGEDKFNLMSGLFKPYGVCIVSGTGASFFWCDENGFRGAIGGLGAYIGDEGSGYYIGEHGIRAAMQCINGWGKKTVLADLYYEMTGGKGPFEYFYGSEFSQIPMHMKISEFTRQVEKACQLGDEVAIDIVHDAGNVLALQTLALFSKYDIPQDVEILLCGGAWKTDPRIKQRFSEIVKTSYPNVNIITPILEPVAGGAVHHAMVNGKLDEYKEVIINNFRGL